MAELHFLRPWWLLALPVGLVLIVKLFGLEAGGSGWRHVVDRALQPLVLTTGDRYAGRRWPLAAALAAWTIATLALAGPAWERLPVPAFRSTEALVVALDMSRSMDAADLSPSRLTRAKLKLLSLLDRRGGGQTGLVVFSAHAFTVTPLTTDTRTIASLVAALSSDIMPSRGSAIEAGLAKAAELLRQASAADGRILVMTDATPSPAAVDLARELARSGFEVNVLGIGTEDGAPIPERDGGFLTDGAGNVVVPRLDARSLARLAEAGGGRFSTMTADDTDLERLLPPQDAGELEEAAGEDPRFADSWRDAGLALAVLLLPLVALGFRRGWVALWLACVLVTLPDGRALAQPPSSDAAEADAAADGPSWRDRWLMLWQRPDQLGEAALAERRAERAARLFEDPEWRAAAQYRAGRFTDSASSLAGLDTADAHYNRGNALARAGQIEPAIAAYDRALELAPDHEDARFNRDLLEQLLAQNPPPPPQQQAASGEEQAEQQGGEPSDSQSENPTGGESGGEESRQAQASPSESPSSSAGADPQDGDTGDSPTADADDAEDGRPEDPDDENADADAEAQLAAASPDDVEQWASDQAAEQWLRRIQQDPGGLLRRKFLYQYQRLGVDQDGNYVWPGDEAEPW